MTNIKEIRLDNIHIDDSLQLRVEGTEPETVQEYAGLVKAGIDMDPVDVVAVGLDWNVDADYVLAHGHHRYDAHVAADRQTIRAIVHDGGRAKARFLAQTGNITNGKPLSKEDKLLVMVDMVLDPAYSDYSSRQFKSEFGIYSQPVWAAVMQVAQMVQQTAPPLLDDEIIEQGSYNSVNERLISLVRERTGISEPLERKWTIGTLVQIDDDHDYFGWRGWITGHMPNGGGVHVLAHQFGKYYWKLSNRSAGYESLSPLKSDSSYSSLWLEKLRREKQVEHVLFKWSDYFVQIDTRTNLDDNAKLHGVDWDKYNFSYPDSDMIALASRISPELLGWYREQFPEEQILVLMPDRINDERMKAIVLKACRARGGAINEPPAPGAPDMEPDNGFQAAASGDDDLITQINANVPGHIDSSDWYGVYQYISRQHAPHLTVIDVPGIGLFAKNTPGNKNQRLALDISHRWKVKLNSTVIYEDREGFFDTARSVDLPVYWYRWVSHDLPDWIERIQSDDLPYSVSKTDTSNSGGCNGWSLDRFIVGQVVKTPHRKSYGEVIELDHDDCHVVIRFFDDDETRSYHPKGINRLVRDGKPIMADDYTPTENGYQSRAERISNTYKVGNVVKAIQEDHEIGIITAIDEEMKQVYVTFADERELAFAPTGELGVLRYRTEEDLCINELNDAYMLVDDLAPGDSVVLTTGMVDVFAGKAENAIRLAHRRQPIHRRYIHSALQVDVAMAQYVEMFASRSPELHTLGIRLKQSIDKILRAVPETTADPAVPQQ